ncbi:16S rRNA (adenine(1518)-N(6)/adenine(1519)-N(6))-dimethyltransferase RsmA [Aerococcaceae bacterium DSM 111176]|nr:16S rRNA (adenine(1518)-N(6)/adenine(1519)-N(6))-dimethyltransferase RsmA [Aerococcaceae bacterium DSM 111176]
MNHKLISTPTRTAAIMKKYDIKMKKSLGQNFLVEPQILDKMIHAAEIDDTTTVIEIGPGIGALTEVLALNAKRVLGFEIDQRFIEILKDTLSPYDNVQVIHQDILDVDFGGDELAWLHQEERLVVVANLPYYITTPIIMNLMKSRLPFERLTMMMQKEVAERMTAEVGTKQYSSLTIAIQNYMESNIAMIVPKTVFIPRPNVDSAVLNLTKREQPLVEVDSPDAFEELVQTAFTQRRKTLWNNLRNAKNSWVEEYTDEQLQLALETAEIEGSRRGETLTIDEYAKLYRSLKND